MKNKKDSALREPEIAGHGRQYRDNPDAMAPASLRDDISARWEYKSVLLNRNAELSGYGAEGWQLVSVIPQAADQAMFYFRRMIRQ
jgi:hypothetical protein